MGKLALPFFHKKKREEIKLKVKNWMIAVLSVCMVCSLMVGCGKGGDGSQSNTDTNTSSNNSGEVIKLTALISKHSLTKDLNTMQWLSDLEASCGVEVEWQQITADWDQKKSPMFASGAIPDLLFNGTVTTDYGQYEGLFEDLSPLIEKEGPNLQKIFSDNPGIKVLVTQLNGKIYSTPIYKGVWPDSVGTQFINKQWLEYLDMEVPTTWDELEQVLIAFRDGDPNQNGEKDEIPMDFNGMEGGFSPLNLLAVQVCS